MQEDSKNPSVARASHDPAGPIFARAYSGGFKGGLIGGLIGSVITLIICLVCHYVLGM